MLHSVFWFCDKLHTKASSGFANKQGMKLQRCADCASEAEHCQKAEPKKALNKPGSNNSTISATTVKVCGIRVGFLKRHHFSTF